MEFQNGCRLKGDWFVLAQRVTCHVHVDGQSCDVISIMYIRVYVCHH